LPTDLPVSNCETLADPFSSLAEDPATRSTMRERARRLAAEHTWERVAAPLLAYCRSPYRTRPTDAADLDAPGLTDRLRAAWWRSPVRRAAGKLRRRLRGRQRGHPVSFPPSSSTGLDAASLARA